MFAMSGYPPVPDTRAVKPRRGGVREGGVNDRESLPDVGDEAPEFELAGTDGKTHRLADHRGWRAVVLAWFPKAYTPG